MKFSHGVWSLRDGVTAIYAERVSEHRASGAVLELDCLNRGPEHKLNAYSIAVRLSSPLPGVIRVQASHRQGRARPRPGFHLEDLGASSGQWVEITEEGDRILFKSGEMTARIAKGSFEIAFFEGERLLTRAAKRGLAVMNASAVVTVPGSTAGATGAAPQPGEFLMQRLSLAVGECIYGFGERFGPFVKNGQSISIWNEDPGTETDLAYKSVPFYLSSAGYGVFVASPAKVDFEVATERTSAVQMSSAEPELDYYVFAGPTPKDALSKYTRLTGRPALPPSWSFGLWLSTSFLTDYDERIVTEELIDGMASRDIPLSVFHYDCLWMREHHWCDFEWDPQKFPDPRGMLRRLHEKGVRVCVWINPYISELSSLFAEGRDRGYFLKNAKGDVYQRDDWQPAIALVDFTNPEATAWFKDKLRTLLQMGVDCFKTDFGERIPADAVYFDGSDPGRMHNFYSYLYNHAVFTLLEDHYGRGNAVVFARSGTAGSQKFPVHWGGDCDSTFESMAETLRGGLSFAMSGGSFWSHDIGGFSGTAPPALYKRWVAFGLLSSHSRLHGASTYRVPWKFDEESVEVLRFFTRLKHRLMPYLFAAAREAHEIGIPVMRPMVLEFPDDPACRHLDRQYMLGSSLLVAPVFNEQGTAEYYLPAGRWTDWFTGEVITGGQWRREERIGFTRIPLFVREGTLLATGGHDDQAVYDYTRDLLLQVFELPDQTELTTTISNSNASRAVTFSCRREGNVLRLSSIDGAPAKLLLRGRARAHSVSNGSAEPQAGSLLVVWKDPKRPLEITLG